MTARESKAVQPAMFMRDYGILTQYCVLHWGGVTDQSGTGDSL